MEPRITAAVQLDRLGLRHLRHLFSQNLLSKFTEF
jgi:hypothetical protein